MREIFPGNAELLRRAASFLLEHAGAREVIAAGPSAGALDLVCHRCCSTALAGVYRYTLRTLVYSLSQPAMYARDLVPLHPVAAESLAASLAREIKLDYLRDSADFPGFARALARTLQDLRLNRISPALLNQAGRSGPDLARLLDRWNHELSEQRFADYALRVELAIGEAAGSPQITSCALLAIDLDLRTAAERHLLETLETRAAATLHLACDRRGTAAANALTSIQRYAATGDAAPPRAIDPSAAFFSASSEALEFVEIARRIVSSGVQFDQIAILLRNPARHVPLLQEAFSRAGIPLWLEGGLRRRDNSGRAFLTLLECRQERFSAARFAEYLSIARLPSEAGGASRSTWERLLNEAAVIAGRERWQSRLDAHMVRLSAAHERRPSETLDYYIESLRSLREFALPMIDRLAALPDQALWREWIAALEELADFAVADPRTIHDALGELAPVAGLGPVSLAEVMSVLERLISEWTQESEGRRYGKVFAARIDDARGMDFHLAFLPGLNEGLFPRAPREDPLLLDEQRRLLSMSVSRDDRELLDIALATAGESAVFSWARLDLATGRERVPSFFAAEVIAAARGSESDLSAILADARNKVSSKIGWSAPEDPAASIDDSEYDLAAFREACRRKSGMAWLRQVSPHAARAIQARRSRWSDQWTEADGISADHDMQAALALKQWEPAQHAYSPTALNQFARCPYRFYLSSIARLKPVERPEVFQRLDPLTRGHLYHRTLFWYLRDPATPLDEVLAKLAAETAEALDPPIRGVWSAEIAKLRADLHAWIRCRDPEWNPQFIELSFGLPDRQECDPSSVPTPAAVAHGIPLCGSIDLVEAHADGRLRVLDHKTGTPERKDWGLCVGRGEVLQPVLYALALEALNHGAPVSAALSWATLRGGFRTDEIRIGTDARDKIGQVLRTIEAYIHRGFLPAAPRADACKNCEYLPVCGPWEEIRVPLKSRAPLKELRDIRAFR